MLIPEGDANAVDVICTARRREEAGGVKGLEEEEELSDTRSVVERDCSSPSSPLLTRSVTDSSSSSFVLDPLTSSVLEESDCSSSSGSASDMGEWWCESACEEVG